MTWHWKASKEPQTQSVSGRIKTRKVLLFTCFCWDQIPSWFFLFVRLVRFTFTIALIASEPEFLNKTMCVLWSFIHWTKNSWERKSRKHSYPAPTVDVFVCRPTSATASQLQGPSVATRWYEMTWVSSASEKWKVRRQSSRRAEVRPDDSKLAMLT